MMSFKKVKVEHLQSKIKDNSGEGSALEKAVDHVIGLILV